MFSFYMFSFFIICFVRAEQTNGECKPTKANIIDTK